MPVLSHRKIISSTWRTSWWT